MRGGALTGIKHQLKVASAQLKSALVLAALQARGRSELTEPARSRDHTERMLRFLGAPISVDAERAPIVVDPTGWNGRLKAAALTIPGDLSSATFLIVAALIVPGSDVVVENVGLNPTRAGALDVLRAMGGDLDDRADRRRDGRAGRTGARARKLAARHARRGRAGAAGDRRDPGAGRGGGRGRGGDDVRRSRPSCGSRSRTASPRWRASSAARGRGSPSSRTASSSTGLGGRPPAGGAVVPEHDHRIAMAGAILGLVGGDETTVPTADIGTSFPTFAETLGALGASI